MTPTLSRLMTGLCVFPYLVSCCMQPKGPWQQLAATLIDSSRFSRWATTVFHNAAQSVLGLEPTFICFQSSCLPVLCLATFVLSEAACHGQSHLARPRQVRFSDPNPVPPHNRPVRFPASRQGCEVTYIRIQSITGSEVCLLTSS